MSAIGAALRTPTRSLPVAATGGRAIGWWGMVLMIGTEAALFASLLASYFYLFAGSTTWPPPGINPPELPLPGVLTVLLVGSSAPMWLADRAAGRGHRGRLALALLVAFLMGLTFLGLQLGVEYPHQTFRPQTNAYGSLFFTITGFHGIHVAVALTMNAVIQVRCWLGHFSPTRRLAVQNVVLYWHFVDVVWLAVFASLYVSPHLL